MRGPVAGAVDQPEHFAGVGQRQHQGVITPGAVVGDVHALFALAAGFHQGAVHVDDGYVEEGGGLLLPDALANLVESRLQGVDVGLGEAAAEVTGSGRVGDTAGAKGIQEIDVVAAQLHVLEVAALAENVVGEVEYVIGLMIRQMDLE